METTNNNIEKQLTKGRSVSMSELERDDMKSSLLGYAQYHGVSPAPVRRTAVWYWGRIASVAAVLLFVFTGTSYASLASMPGDTLYPLKVEIVEEALGMTRLTEERQLAYKVQLLQERLREVQLMSDRHTLTPTTFAILEGQVAEHIDALEVLVDGDTDNSLHATVILQATSDAVSLARAIERASSVVDHNDTTTMALEASVDQIADLHKEESAQLLTEASAQDVEGYIETQLAELAAEVAESDLAATTTAQIAEDLEEISVALAAGDLARALTQANDAVQNVVTEEYLTDFDDEVAE